MSDVRWKNKADARSCVHGNESAGGVMRAWKTRRGGVAVPPKKELEDYTIE